MGKCAETVRRKRKCHNCGATEMEKGENQDGKEEANKSKQSIFSLITGQSNCFLKCHPKKALAKQRDV